MGRVLAAHLVFGPESGEDLQISVEQVAALFERDADGVELPGVPAAGQAEDEPTFRDDVQRRRLLGQNRRVSQWEDEDARPQLDRRCVTRDGRQKGQRVQDREAGLHAEEDVVPHPNGIVLQLLRALAKCDEVIRIGHLRIGRKAPDAQAKGHTVPSHLFLLSTMVSCGDRMNPPVTGLSQYPDVPGEPHMPLSPCGGVAKISSTGLDRILGFLASRR